MNATAEGSRIRVECEAGTFYLQPWEARKAAAEIAAAADDLFVGDSTNYGDSFERAVREHREWYARREAELRGDPEC